MGSEISTSRSDISCHWKFSMIRLILTEMSASPEVKYEEVRNSLHHRQQQVHQLQMTHKIRLYVVERDDNVYPYNF